jgi:hypothetical protein
VPRIRKVSLFDIQDRLPKIEPLDTGRAAAKGQADLYMCALGFEDRCTSIPASLADSGFQASHAVIFEYSTNLRDNNRNSEVLTAALKKMLEGAPSRRENITYIEVDDERFLPRTRRVLENLVRSKEGPVEKLPTVFVDISVSSTKLTLALFKLLMDFDIDLTVVYSEAEVYYPTEEEWKTSRGASPLKGQRFLEKGLRDVSIVADYPGAIVEPIPDLVVVIPNFHRQRARAAIAQIDPALLPVSEERLPKSIVWILGIPHRAEDAWRLNAVRESNGLPAGHDTAGQVHRAETFGYVPVLMLLESIYSQFELSHRMTVVPMGSKLQALGVAFFCRIHPDVRLVVSTPKSYEASHYTGRCRAMWMIPFRSTGALRSSLAKVDRLEVV